MNALPVTKQDLTPLKLLLASWLSKLDTAYGQPSCLWFEDTLVITNVNAYFAARDLIHFLGIKDRYCIPCIKQGRTDYPPNNVIFFEGSSGYNVFVNGYTPIQFDQSQISIDLNAIQFAINAAGSPKTTT